MRVTVEASGDRPVVSVALTRAECAAALAGQTLRFVAPLPDRARTVQLVRNDVEPSGPTPDVRLRVAAGVFSGVSIGGEVTPIFTDVPFSLRLSLAVGEAPADGPVQLSPGLSYHRDGTYSAVTASAAPSKQPARPSGGEDRSLDAYATMGAGVFLILMGALRTALSTRASDTNTLMMIAGGGTIVYGIYRWIVARAKS